MGTLSHIKGVSLDAAGTLIEVAEPVAEVYGRIAAAHGAELDSDALGRGFRTHFASMPPMAFPGAESDALPRLERAWWRTLVRRVVSEAGAIDGFEAFFDDLYDHYGEASAWRLYDDVADLVNACREQEIRVVVLSNFDSRLTPVAAGLGLTEMVDEVLYSTALGAAKPDGGAFAAAATALAQPPEACLHIGDNESADWEGARAAGFEARLLERRPSRKRRQNPDRIGGLHEVIGDLKKTP